MVIFSKEIPGIPYVLYMVQPELLIYLVPAEGGMAMMYYIMDLGLLASTQGYIEGSGDSQGWKMEC